MTRKKAKKTKMDILLDCPCGAKAAVYQNAESKWFAHCVSCGRLVFWTSHQLTERVRGGGKLCPHNPELKMCKDGNSKTSWCKACRVRVFLPVF